MDLNDTESEEIFFGPITKCEIISKLRHYNLVSEEVLKPLQDFQDSDALDNSLIEYYDDMFPKGYYKTENDKSYENMNECASTDFEESSIIDLTRNSLDCTKEVTLNESQIEKKNSNMTTDEKDEMKQTEESMRNLNISEENLDNPRISFTKIDSFSTDSIENSELISLHSSLEQSDTSYSKTNNSGFNYTLEEMEMLLKYGENYIKNDYVEITEEKENIPMCSNDNAIDKNDKENIQFIPPTPKTPKYISKVTKRSPNYKNIVSPIAMYIKGNPQVPLVQKISMKPVHMGTFREASSKSDKFVEQIRPTTVLPIRSYKPAAKTALISQEEEIILPNNIRKLMQCTTPRVIRHVGRVQEVPEACVAVQEQSTREDMTMLSDSINAEGDVSVYVSKTVSRSNCLIKKN